MTRETAMAAVNKYGGQEKAAAALRVSRDVIRSALGRDRSGGGKAVANAEEKVHRGISVRDFMGKFNYGKKLSETIKRLCRTDFVLDSEIRAAADIPVAYFRSVADLPEFADNKVKDGDRIYWSSAENVARVKAEQKKWGIVR